MIIISWNINGFKSIINKGLNQFLKKESPDIMCLQETRVSDEQVINGYDNIWFNSKKKGYSGTATLTRIKPLSIKKGLGIKKFDEEGRTITIEFKEFYLVNSYSPNAGRELKRLEYKNEYNKALMNHLLRLKRKKEVILTGDLNVAHQPIDLARPKQNEGHAGYTINEREWLTQLLNNGFTDAFRKLHPRKQEFTWWTYRFHAREKNIGWRIDYFIVSNNFMNKVKSVKHLVNIKGSDHCPIRMELNI